MTSSSWLRVGRAEPLDLLRELRKLKPTVVHFSGHGMSEAVSAPPPAGDGPHRDVVVANHATDPAQHGLYFQGPDGRPHLVSTAALKESFGAAGSSVKVVVLNACYSDVHAAALVTHVDCVVGMSGPVGDDAARSFAVGFYGGIGDRESVAQAYKQGRAAIHLMGIGDSDRAELTVRDGINAARLFLSDDIQIFAISVPRLAAAITGSALSISGPLTSLELQPSAAPPGRTTPRSTHAASNP